MVATTTAVFATRFVTGLPSGTRVVKLDPATGSEQPWTAPVARGSLSAVNAMAVEGSRLYLVGEFTTINGQTRHRLAAVDVATGALDAWAPLVGGSVTALGVSGQVVAIGGRFRSVGGIAKRNLVSVDLRTGRPTALAVPDVPFGVYAFLRLGDAIVVGGVRPYTIPLSGGPDVAAFSRSSGQWLPWSLESNGWVSALATDGRQLFVGGTFSSISGVEATARGGRRSPVRGAHVVESVSQRLRDDPRSLERRVVRRRTVHDRPGVRPQRSGRLGFRHRQRPAVRSGDAAGRWHERDRLLS
jgi:hypothetical protein